MVDFQKFRIFALSNKKNTKMKRKDLLKVREDLSAEILGIVKTRGTYDVERKIYVLRCYRGMDEPNVCAVMYSNRDDGIIPISGWFRSVVFHITLLDNGNLVVCSDVGFAGTNELCVDDLLDIRDFLRDMTEEDIIVCNNYDYAEEDEIDEERREEFMRECERPWHY